MKRINYYFTSLAVLATHATTAFTQQHPNVIIIYADDMGFGDLECYGAKNVSAPNVNKLASEGCRITNAFAVAATSAPSRYSQLN